MSKCTCELFEIVKFARRYEVKIARRPARTVEATGDTPYEEVLDFVTSKNGNNVLMVKLTVEF